MIQTLLPLDDIPDPYKGVFRKAFTGNSLRAAINAKCLDCSNYQKQEINQCTVKNCPLYKYRPYQRIKQE